MITGLNTAVTFKEHEYHVQTEDRGHDNPVIESMIYQGGAILGSKKTSYKELLKSGSFSEDKLREALERQHYAIVHAIRTGRVTARQQKRARPKARPLPPDTLITPHVELVSRELGEGADEDLREMRIRIIETFNARPISNAEVSVEVFGKGITTQRLRGVTDDEGFLTLKIDVPGSHRVAAAMLFRVDKPDPSQELKVLFVRSEKK
ncbi:MAG: hypothetical protein LAO31_17175 [Acidobacteriia bacterium]|nr:hypothetical protein [Terriglobia bacterium]